MTPGPPCRARPPGEQPPDLVPDQGPEDGWDRAPAASFRHGSATAAFRQLQIHAACCGLPQQNRHPGIQDSCCDFSWQQEDQKPSFCFSGAFLRRCAGHKELERYLESSPDSPLSGLLCAVKANHWKRDQIAGGWGKVTPQEWLRAKQWLGASPARRLCWACRSPGQRHHADDSQGATHTPGLRAPGAAWSLPSPASLLLICPWPLGTQCSLCLLREKPVKQPRQVFSPGVHPFSGTWEAKRLSQGCRLAGGRAALQQPALPSCQSLELSPLLILAR